MKLESIEKLREMDRGYLIPYGNGYYRPDTRHGQIADEIEREIAERYMELPVDVDGVPIHVGDKMEVLVTGERICVYLIGDEWVEDANGVKHSVFSIRHVKPDQVSELLNSFLEEYDASTRPDEEIIAKYAAKIREAVSADE